MTLTRLFYVGIHFEEEVMDLSVKDWDIKVDGDQGYFEWVGGTNEDEGCAGMLLFEGNVLYDYDGVFSLPSIVKNTLIKAGFDLSDLDEAGEETE